MDEEAGTVTFELKDGQTFTLRYGEGGEEDPGPGSIVDLSANGTANCYIVSAAGNYKFKANVKGNGTESVGSVDSPAVLWESFGTATAPEVGDLVSDVKFENGYISFTASNKKGNALIAAKDAAGTILWSWHIWMTDQPVDQAYLNSAGTMMDRNLGATSATPGQASALGLYYQWGRKDPFLGSSNITSIQQAKFAGDISWTTAASDQSTGTIGYSFVNPTTFIYGSDWLYRQDATLWGSTKTIYDPCPVGYRVPDGGSQGVWAKAYNNGNFYVISDPDMDYDKLRGYQLGNSAAKPITTADSCWYPFANFMRASDGKMMEPGSGCGLWSCTFDSSSKKAFRQGCNNSGRITFYHLEEPASGYPVRCQKIETQQTGE